MKDSKRLPIPLVLALLLALPGLAWAQTERNTCTDRLLLPYFEVTPDSPARTTVFVLTNTSDQDDTVTVQVFDRNGARVFQGPLDFKKFEEKAVDLRSWFPDDLKLGKLKDPARSDTAIGYVAFRATRKVFCGNYYLLQADETLEDGEMLIHLPGDPCRRHSVFLRKAGVEDSDSQVTVWVEGGRDKLTTFGYDKKGERHELETVELTRTQVLSIRELGWTPQSEIQWLELVNQDRDSFVVAHYLDPDKDRGSMLFTCCFPPPPPPQPPDCTKERPGLSITKTTNGQARATNVPPGSTVNFAYVVENTGNVALIDVVVKDQPPPANLRCGASALATGAKMSCQASGKAVDAPGSNFSNTATVTATSDGEAKCRTTVSASAKSGYTTAGEPICQEGPARLRFDKKTNGRSNAGQVDAGSEVTWTFDVTNTGQATVKEVRVTDSPDPGPIACTPQKTVLKPGESLSCTAKGTAVEGTFRNTATVTGVSECGKDVRATANSGYRGKAPRDDRFMTGGAFIRDTPFGKFDVQITKLNCDGSPPANLNVEWGGQGNQRQQFKLHGLTSVRCSDTPGVEPGPPAASFDTAIGTGTGKVRGENATISFKFVDAGEKGANRDSFDVTIQLGGETIHVAGKIDGGDYQAHK